MGTRSKKKRRKNAPVWAHLWNCTMQRLEVLKGAFFGLDAIQQQLLIGSAVAAGGILMHMVYKRQQVKSIPLGEGWWGAGKKPLSEDDQIYPFKVQTSQEEIEDLHARIDRTRYTDPLEDSCFQYGFNSTYLKTVVSYWRHKFDWTKQVAVLNQYPHFKTKIEGLDVHYVHVRPPHRANQTVVPLMLVHGWPGSFYEFYKILPLLTENQDGLVFEVICPSIPGYGFSDAPHKQGFDSLAAARIFLTLMERLGFSQFYLQGGDWGSLITTNMAQMKPLCVKGLHLNMFISKRGFKVMWSLMIGSYLPFLVGFSREDVRRLFPFFEKNVWNILKETGYMHIQATKPDTAGCGLNDSPVGLAAYILEKFSSWTDLGNTELVDGGLERKLSLDDVLTNVMIYWTTGSIVSSMRFYKENLKSNLDNRVDAKIGIFVPTGLAAFPGELMHCPKSWAQIREKQFSSKVIIHMNGNSTSIHKPSPVGEDQLKDGGKTFSYDFSYDSTDRGRPTFISQERIFHDLGSDVLKAAFEGFNACVFAYGQTGSGKSYTMMGHRGDKGLIPRICEGFFCEISRRGKSEAVSFRTEVSYLEIYNERVQDLLKKKTTPTYGGLRVREHPRDGPYVENLSKLLVHNHSDMEDLIILGNANRTTASTNMNDLSSRSHAIFTISFTQAWFDAELPRETLSKIHLVDLAGSERADATLATGTRLKEGANINKSLVSLGTVISALADLNVGGQSSKKKKPTFIPYRDSVLTWLLKDSLGGNSLTTMIATVSPADVNYGETLSTLRYASRAKNIVNSPTVNEDGSVKVIRELQEEVTRLRRLLEEANQVSRGELSSSVKVEEELHQNQTRVLALTKEWTSKWGETRSILQEETVALRKEGSGVVLGCQLPHLIGMDEDLLSTGIVLYYLKEGRTLIGSDEASSSRDIVLHGPGLLGEHCVLENRAGTVTLIPQDGALCSVNGSVVTDPCQLTQGAITRLGRETILRFNHPTEAAQLRHKRQRGPQSDVTLSLSDMSKSAENLLSKVMLQNQGRMGEMLNQQEVEQQQVQESMNKRNRDIKGLSKENSGAPPHQRGAGEKTTVAEIEETGDGQNMNMLAAEMDEVPSSGLTSAPIETHRTTAMPGKYPVSHTIFQLDGDPLQGGMSTRDGQEQERDLCHKSELMSEWPWRKAQSGAGVASYNGEEVRSGDASLQQTNVLGPGDGCGTKPEGNANKIKGVVADCYKERPGSGGSSLGIMSHLQSRGATGSPSVLPQTSTHSQLDKKPLGSQVACCPPEETTFKGQFGCGEMDESGGLEEIPGVCETETAAATGQRSGLGSLVSRVSLIFQDAGRLLWSSPTVLQQVKEEGLQPVGARWSSHVVSVVRESNVLSVVKDSQVFSIVKGSFVFSLFKDSHIFSIVKNLYIQHVQMEITQPKEEAQMIQGCVNPDRAQGPFLTPTQIFSKAEDLPEEVPLMSEDIWTKNKRIGDLRVPQVQDMADIHASQGDKLNPEMSAEKPSEPEVSHAPEDKGQVLENLRIVQNRINVQIFCQTLIDFPDSLLYLQTLPFLDMIDTLQSIISTSVLASQKIVALFWVTVAKCSHPEPRPALLILAETGLYTLTADFGLGLFHHLPLFQLKELKIGLAGHSLRLMGATEESVLGVYTHSQLLTKELCSAILAVICPGDNRVSRHPLLHGDLMKLSFDWQACVPDLLLDAGLRVCSQFQKSLADLVYLLQSNMDHKTVTLGEVQILLYTGVRVCISPSTRSEPLAQLLLTDTHLGLVQDEAVFHPTPRSVTIAPRSPQFHDLTLRQRSDVRCVLVHDEDERGAVSVDVILANARCRGHPESVTKAASPPAPASNSSRHAEVWKLTFSCSSEAAFLINHLSNV